MVRVIQPTYTLTLPSSGEKIQYRPFTVKEEKSLILALEEGDPINTVAVIKNLVYVCTEGKLDGNVVPYYDIEFAFLMIRAKSVGETIDLLGKCDCSETVRTEFSVDILDSVVNFKTNQDIVKIPDSEYYVKMKHPPIDDIISGKSETDTDIYESITKAIDIVYTEQEVYDTMTVQEKVEFLDSLNSKQQKVIAQHLEDMPEVSLKGSYICKNCKKQHTVEIAGLADFFV